MKKKNKEAKFSISLGLFDYINPILYGITCYFLIINLNNKMPQPFFTIFIIGTIISLLFGLTIPTVKLLVGLGKMKFKMPVNLVFFVNTGILISGTMLLKYISDINITMSILLIDAVLITLLIIYYICKKFNTIAVLTGAFGYIFLYISLITKSINDSIIISTIFYSIAIMFFVTLCGIGIKANLKNPKVHWIIEISNVLCQLLVTVGTILLFI